MDKVFTKEPYSNARLYDVSVHLLNQQNEDEQTIPAFTDNEGQSGGANAWDRYPIQIYHRVITTTQTPDEDESDGNLNNIVNTITSMVCVVTNDRKQTKTKPEDLAIGIMSGMNVVFSDTDINTTGIDYAGIEVGEANYDKGAVAAQEYITLPDLAPYYDLFSINYNIVQKIDTRCFQLV